MEFQPFLLPQGYSTVYQAQVSQFIDLRWCNSDDHLSSIGSNPVARKPFAKKSVLCIGPEFIPRSKVRVNSPSPRPYIPKYLSKQQQETDKQPAIEHVPRIILTMGAKRVEAITELNYASKHISDFDYVVIPDGTEHNHEYGDKCVDVSWVKACLVAGKRLITGQLKDKDHSDSESESDLETESGSEIEA
jgi:hypothetical protein